MCNGFSLELRSKRGKFSEMFGKKAELQRIQNVNDKFISEWNNLLIGKIIFIDPLAVV